ncbi:MAG: hypothetical protein RLZ18_68 [Actinomycetota bacterium]
MNDTRFLVIEAGFTGNEMLVREHMSSVNADVRASALRALHRLNVLNASDLNNAITDHHHEVRRTAIELASQHEDVAIHQLLNDADVFVAEMAAWSLGERMSITDDEIQALITATTNHHEPVVREACAAALGSLGDERGLAAILVACNDKPAVRRRAILALAPFEGEEVEAALQHALEDNDWQVRQNAEVLLNPRD